MTFGKTLTKLEIAESVAKKCGFKKKLALELVNATLEEIRVFLENNIEVKLSKFGNLKVKYKKERYGRNPKTKQSAIIAARKVIVFKANKTLNKKINAGRI